MSSNAPLDVPEQLGPYKVLRPLGSGSMATVYLAEQAGPGGFRKRVALKIIRADLAEDETFVRMLMREAAIGGMLQHPNIVQTLSFEQFNNFYVLVLEFVDGKSVDQLMKAAEGQGLTPSVALDIVIQTCRGLSYAQRIQDDDGKLLSIVHRDLKPANLMRSAHGVVKIMDFGIARAQASWAELTAQGVIRGTPSYMSPEQVLGRELDGRSDLFCLGAILYETLTGKVLFTGPTMIKVMEKIAQVQIGDAVDEADAVVPGVSGPLQRALSPYPNDRYADPMEFADDLKALLLDSGQSGVQPGRTVARMAALEELSEVSEIGGMTGDEETKSQPESLRRDGPSAKVPGPSEDGTGPERRRKRKKKRKKKRKRREGAAQTTESQSGSTPAKSASEKKGLGGLFGFGKKKEPEKQEPGKKRRKKRKKKRRKKRRSVAGAASASAPELASQLDHGTPDDMMMGGTSDDLMFVFAMTMTMTIRRLTPRRSPNRLLLPPLLRAPPYLWRMTTSRPIPGRIWARAP